MGCSNCSASKAKGRSMISFPFLARSCSARSRYKHWLAGLLLALALTACSGQELYRDVEEREANEMISVLMRAGIDASKGTGEKDTFTVKVATSDFPQAVEVLRQNGLPREDFETLGSVFEKEGFTSTTLAEQARFVFATSQELSNTISQFDGVIEARVHLALPKADALTGLSNPPSASVFVKYREGMDLPAQTAAIKSLVTNSIEGLDYNKVSVAMTEAKPLPSVPEDPLGDMLVATIIPVALALGVLLLLAAGWRLYSLRSAAKRHKDIELPSSQAGHSAASGTVTKTTMYGSSNDARDYTENASQPAE
ncbi:MAG: type III secretion inner membrane ring lipoprotein SctJ [Pseudomonadota bacterium]